MSLLIARLMTVEQIQATVVVSETIPEKYYNVHINTAQRDFVRPILGDPLYIELQEQVLAEEVSAENIVLLNNIYPLLAYRFAEQYMTFGGFYMTPQGPKEHITANSEPLASDKRAHLVGAFRNQAETYTNNLRQFLNDNASDYPLWNQQGGENCNVKEDFSFGISKIAMPRRRNWDGETGAGTTRKRY